MVAEGFLLAPLSGNPYLPEYRNLERKQFRLNVFLYIRIISIRAEVV